MKHKAVRIDDLMYKGCEPHWKCIHCGECVPFHCYKKAEFEELECETKNSSEKLEGRKSNGHSRQ